MKFSLQDAKGMNSPIEVRYYLSPSDNSGQLLDKTNYQSLIGSLLYISLNTRPDISASINILAQRVSYPSQNDWNQLKRVVKYLKTTAKFKLKLGDTNDNNIDWLCRCLLNRR